MRVGLIVDDSKIVRKVTRKMLESIGFTVTEAENGEIGLSEFEKVRPELILLDWHMPVLDGLAFLKRLRSSEGGEKPVVIFCTTETDISHIQEAMLAGANEYVMKPFDEEILRSKLSQLGLI